MSPVPAQRKVINRQVADLLDRSDAFNALPDNEKRQIFHDTAKVVSALSDGDPSNPLTGSLAEDGVNPLTGGRNRPGRQKHDGSFKAEALNQGVDAIASLIDEVDFPSFVAELIRGTFQAIVDASIQQMREYGELVKSVAMSLNEFRDEQVTSNQGREHLMQRYPGFFDMNFDDGRPSLVPNEDADFESIDIGRDMGIADLGEVNEENVERVLVPAARTQIAQSRQRLLATMVMMGINRIIVTDGEINARVKFKFSASDQFTSHAQKYDYENQGMETSVRSTRRTAEDSGERKYKENSKGQNRLSSVSGAKRYTTGAYHYAQRPRITLSSAENTTAAGAIEARGEMMGSVRVKFKSETFPLEKMLDSDQMLQLQNAQQRGTQTASGPAAAPATPATPTAPPTTGTT